MKTVFKTLALASVLSVGVSTAALAQNLVVRGARIIVSPSQTIEHGDLVVTDGRISAVTPTPAPAAGRKAPAPAAPKGVTVINGEGMTLIAGYMDGHRHIIQGRGPDNVAKFLREDAAKRMGELLEAGVTTVQSGGDDNAGILQLKKMVESGQIKGPRIITSAGVSTFRLKDEAEVRAAVRAAVASGADSIAEVHYPEKVWPYNPTVQETKNLEAGIDEAKKLGVEFQVHAVSDQSLTGAVHIGAKKLIHTVNINFVSAGQAKEVARAGAEVATITGFGSPNFDVFSKDNKPKFRDGKPWPEGIVDSQGVGQEAGYMPVNTRTLFDAGVNIAYATDTTFYAPAAFAHEIKTLALVFSNPDLVKILGPNSAKFLNKEKDNGTLEVGKLADFNVLGGNPYDGFWFFFNPVVVVKGGVIQVDKRGQPDAGKPIVRYGY
jgi:imidazolonepropionase-like amidohydrolase